VWEEVTDGWAGAFDDFVARFAGRFGRVESRRRMVSYLRGLLSEAERKNGWVRHEALCDRVEVEDLYRRAVAAVG
jgi:hypothetical protein